MERLRRESIHAYRVFRYPLPVISSFGDATTADIYHGNDTKAARRIGRELWGRVKQKLDFLTVPRSRIFGHIPPIASKSFAEISLAFGVSALISRIESSLGSRTATAKRFAAPITLEESRHAARISHRNSSRPDSPRGVSRTAAIESGRTCPISANPPQPCQ